MALAKKMEDADGAPPPPTGTDASVSSVTGDEFADAAGMVEQLQDPLAAHMSALRRQLGGSFRDLTTPGEDPSLDAYVEGGEGGEGGGAAAGEAGDPREFYERVQEHQRMLDGGEEGAGSSAQETLLASVPPVTAEGAATLAAMYEQQHGAIRSVPAPDDDSFEPAEIQPDKPVWVRVEPERTPVRGENEEDDEDVALLRQMAALSVDRSPPGMASGGALDQAQRELTDAAEGLQHKNPRKRVSTSDPAAEAAEAVRPEELLAKLGSAVDQSVAEIASVMLDGAASGSAWEEDEDDDDPVRALLALSKGEGEGLGVGLTVAAAAVAGAEGAAVSLPAVEPLEGSGLPTPTTPTAGTNQKMDVT